MSGESERSAWSMALYMRDLRRLGAESRGERPTRRRGPQARHEDLVRPHLPYVVHMAVKLSGRGVPVEDLINEGNIGLLEAAERYDPGRNTRFLTYASWYVRKRMLRTLMRDSRNVRLTEYQLKRLRQSARRAHDAQAGGSAEPEAPATSRRELVPIEQAAQLLQPEISLDAPHPDLGEGRSMRSQIADTRRPSPEEHWMASERREVLLRAVDSQLTDQERRILRQRFGLDNGTPRKLREIGVQLGLSRERVRQLETRALAKLRRHMVRAETPRRVAEQLGAAPSVAMDPTR